MTVALDADADADAVPVMRLPAGRDDSTFTLFQPTLYLRACVVDRGSRPARLLPPRCRTRLLRVRAEPVEIPDPSAEARVAMLRAPRARALTNFISKLFDEDALSVSGQMPRPTAQRIRRHART